MRVDPNFISGLTGSLNSIAATQQRLTQQMSSGSRVNELSDDSIAVSDAARLQASKSTSDTFISTAASVTGRMQAMDAALATVVQQLTSAISLATQAANGTVSAANRSAIMEQMSSIRDSVVSSANTSYLGQYLFAGSKSASPAFSPDGTYLGDGAEQRLTTPSGGQVVVSLPGSDLFSDTNVMAALNNAITGVAAGAGPEALTAALDSLSAKRSSLNASLKNLQDQSDAASDSSSRLKVQQTQLLGVDAASLATDLSNSETQQKALLSIIAAIGKSNLFDYL